MFSSVLQSSPPPLRPREELQVHSTNRLRVTGSELRRTPLFITTIRHNHQILVSSITTTLRSSAAAVISPHYIASSTSHSLHLHCVSGEKIIKPDLDPMSLLTVQNLCFKFLRMDNSLAVVVTPLKTSITSPLHLTALSMLTVAPPRLLLSDPSSSAKHLQPTSLSGELVCSSSDRNMFRQSLGRELPRQGWIHHREPSPKSIVGDCFFPDPESPTMHNWAQTSNPNMGLGPIFIFSPARIGSDFFLHKGPFFIYIFIWAWNKKWFIGFIYKLKLLRLFSIDVVYGSRVSPPLLMPANNLSPLKTVFLGRSSTLLTGCINVGIKSDNLVLVRVLVLGIQVKFLHRLLHIAEHDSPLNDSIFPFIVSLVLIISPLSMSPVVIAIFMN